MEKTYSELAANKTKYDHLFVVCQNLLKNWYVVTDSLVVCGTHAVQTVLRFKVESIAFRPNNIL